MNFKQLEYFSAVAEAKSISLAARQLHVAQPPVSRQLALLEDELGVCLFTRNNKGVELTEAGQSLYRQSQQMFQDMHTMVDSVRDVGAGTRGLLKIGVIYSDIPILFRHLREYRQKYPRVEFYFRLGTPRDLLYDLGKGSLHVLFLRSSQDEYQGLHKRLLKAEPLELVMLPELDPAPDCDEVPVEKLRGVPMCLLRSDDLWGYSNSLISECRKQGFLPNTICECYDTPMAMQLVQAGFGVGYLPRSIAMTHPHSNLITKPVSGLTASSRPVMLWSDGGSYAPCVKLFLDLFAQNDEEKG